MGAVQDFVDYVTTSSHWSGDRGIIHRSIEHMRLSGASVLAAGIVEASRGMGMGPMQVLLRVEAPIARPLILTGVRVAALQVIATATLGAFVGFNGLGSYINEGFRQLDDGKLYTGAVFVAVLALLTELVFAVIARRATPWLAPARIDPALEDVQLTTKGTIQ